MILRQNSALDGFAYEFLDDTESLVLGGFHYAWFAQAKNARLRFFNAEDAAKGDIQMTLHGQAWRVRHCYLSRGYVSDIRYTLETTDESIHAQADVLGHSAGQRLPRIVMTQPADIEVGTSSGWLTKNFPVTYLSTGQSLGCIRERSAITFKRELVINLPGMEPAVAAFLGIVALIVRY
ncbi:MAG: hypothetical protein ABS39_02290 [Acidovorax sp. SCN 65-28]|uniref:hypothetical protein n=1 Tax=Acidovorax sp. TaxID=1872122 RepID=UPI00086BA58A|nr:hypothetical protein [Acidovorax sp.]MBN9628047.1 hypothetical protein [Acidovorax sp.]ODS79614.1 MAG: hypothetical protein ABS39_02290 [Acidovorax sp. SCN 65-28]